MLWRVFFGDEYKRVGTVILIILLIPAGVGIVFNIMRYRENLRLFDYMGEIEYINKIRVDYGSSEFVISIEDAGFDEIFALLYPFDSNIRGHGRVARRQSSGSFEIIYYVDGTPAFSVDVFLFTDNPMAENSIFSRNVFTVGQNYALAFMSDVNVLVNFGFDSWMIESLVAGEISKN